MNGRGVALLLVLLVTACSSPPEKETGVTTERQSLDRSARLAFVQGQYAQAATLYQAALEAALAEDAPRAIIDARFNLAVSQMYLGDYRAAIDQATQADAERIRRGLGPDSELQLLQSTIRYRAGDVESADRLLAPLINDPALAEATAEKAWFLAGLIAADRAEADELRHHLAQLESLGLTDTTADRLELSARLAGIDGDIDRALYLFDRAAAMRSMNRDYRGMVRVLAGAGDLAERHDRYRLAGTYLLRAGRSAAQREGPQARGWLERARDLGQRIGDDELVLEATSILQDLSRNE